MNKLTTDLEKQISKKLATLEEFNNNAAWYQSLVDDMAEVGFEVRFPGTLDFSATGTKPKLLAGIKVLRRHGYKMSKGVPEKTDYFGAWCYYHDNDGNKDESRIDVYFSFSSTVCQRVKVGTRMVEEDIYEIQCGE